MKTLLATVLLCAPLLHAADPVPPETLAFKLKLVEGSAGPKPRDVPGFPMPVEGAALNPLIDYAAYVKIAKDVAPIRTQRRLTEEQFAAAAAEPGTIVLDARSADKYALRHIRGAVSLPFTDFTADALAQVIPAKDMRVLIYCNNNFLGAPRAFQSKLKAASLNISTYIALATYGYTNVFELGPLLDVTTTKLPFEGTEVQKAD